MSIITVDGRRYDLGSMTEISYSTREQGGVSVEGAWFGPRSKRIIVGFYSIWDKGNGETVGRFYEVYNPGDVDYLTWWSRLNLDTVAECPIEPERE